jgi:hypothetical protein
MSRNDEPNDDEPNDDVRDQPDAGADRRRFLKGAAAAAAVGGITAASFLNAPSAAASGVAPASPNALLPWIGAEIPCSCLAVNTPLQIRTSLFSVDFRGGIKVRVDVNPDDPVNSVRLRVVGHKVSAELPGPQGASGGSVTIEQNDVNVDPKSLLRIVQSYPPRFEQIMVLNFTMVIEQPQAMLATAGIRSSKAYEPLILTTKDPAKLIGSLTQFPPRGDLYQLQNPVDLIDLENPDNVVATIQKFPVKVGGI